MLVHFVHSVSESRGRKGIDTHTYYTEICKDREYTSPVNYLEFMPFFENLPWVLGCVLEELVPEEANKMDNRARAHSETLEDEVRNVKI